MSLFTDRTVLITGASRGLGEAFAVAVAERGAVPLLTARSADDLARVAGLVRERTGRICEVLPADAGSEDGLRGLIADVDRLGRPVDVLINNAGFGGGGRFAELHIEHEIAMVRLNVEACLRLARHFLPGMLVRRSGGIINVASLGAFMPMPFMATYGATKAFLLSWSEALWGETRGTGVRVTALCPGPVPTNFNAVAGLPPSHNRAGAIDPATAVEAAIRAFEDDRPSVVPGTIARLTSLAPRVLPRKAMIGMAADSIGGRVLPERRGGSGH
jgi:short-subunit dehydrogenase